MAQARRRIAAARLYKTARPQPRHPSNNQNARHDIHWSHRHSPDARDIATCVWRHVGGHEHGGPRSLGDDVHDRYLDAAAAVATPGTARELSIVLTPLHGVGGEPERRERDLHADPLDP